MNDTLIFMAAPFAACLILTGIHCYLGLHVVSRGVIFVDLALAQVAALGTTLALLLGYELRSPQAYCCSLGFTFVGAAIFSVGRFRDEKVPQEAIIGIVYAVCSAAAILVLDRAPHGHEAITAMLVGSILYVTWPGILKTFIIYALVGVVHYLLRHKFLQISLDAEEAWRKGLSVRWWDFVFYVTFGFVVTSSVQIAGVLLVFSYLVVPAVCAMLFAQRILSRLLIGWTLGFVASAFGMFASVQWDLPTGASVVTAFGIVLLICAAVAWLMSLGRARCFASLDISKAPD
ncbi:MAG: metal ABC transporter permease [Candidatus Abyssobacteria bacterium SURF_5]|jgi:zinc/manganese transport system permease protein|uniref:Metal ABC transporter permease n=1 Tax=Abyssobacteria bacterium (strain SURF_5) TaxID=2093360 RepID=A0A3A4P2S8_ABYX5|nr:MAG: metal ABC transporter permease [Candidatus Abyssubacteria bacterium SURF_5]